LKAGFISLGCAKNLVDTEVMLGILQDNGIELTPDPAEAEIIIAKQRNGPIGTVTLLWQPEYTRFVNAERGS